MLRDRIFPDPDEAVFRAIVGEPGLRTHPASACEGQRACCIHKPSNHPLKNAPLNWRADRQIMERICEHGIGHDDPDDLWYRRNVSGHDTAGIHSCDGCCQTPLAPTKEPEVPKPINVKAPTLAVLEEIRDALVNIEAKLGRDLPAKEARRCSNLDCLACNTWFAPTPVPNPLTGWRIS